MAKRSADWNEGLAADLRDKEFAREFIVALLGEGFSLQQALAKTIRAYGVKEFAKQVHMPSSNLVRSLAARANPTQRTLEALLKPFGLHLTAAAAAPKPTPRSRPRTGSSKPRLSGTAASHP